MTRRELSKRIGIPPASIYNYLYTDTQPTLKVLKKCATYFGVPLSTFLEEEPVAISEEKALYGELTKDEIQWLDICRKAKELSPERLEIVITVLEANLKALGLLGKEEKLWKKIA